MAALAQSDFQGVEGRAAYGGLSLLDRVIALPPDAVEPPSAYNVLIQMAYFADRRIFNPPRHWLGHGADLTDRSVRPSLDKLEAGGWIIRKKNPAAARGRETTYAIIVEKLVCAPPPWTAEVARLAAAFGNDRRVSGIPDEQENDADHAEGISARRVKNAAAEAEEISDGSEIFSGEGGNDCARARARPSPSIHPTFLAYPWPSEEMRKRAAQVLDTTGPGMASFDRYAWRILTSLEVLLEGFWADETFFRREVLPMVDRKTEEPRERKKRLKDFYLIHKSILEDIEGRGSPAFGDGRRRARREGALAMKDGGVETFEPSVSEPRVVIVRRIVERMRRGNFFKSDILQCDRLDFEVGYHEEKARACARALAQVEAELAQLEGGREPHDAGEGRDAA